MQANTRVLSVVLVVLLTVVVGWLVMAAPRQQQDGVEGVAAAAVRKAELAPAPPVTFADADGQELVLEELTANVAVHGMLSLTELEFRFRNPQERRIEGRFTCTLPPNAAISRFAKEVNGQLMEGEVVERLRANQVYEQFLHQMRDPALLEQDQGNRFSARIFPIEGKAQVRLVLSYTTLLPLRDGLRTYSLPLRGLPKVNKLTFRAFVTPIPGEEQLDAQGMRRSTAEVVSFEETDKAPEHDVVLSWRPTAGAQAQRVLRSGDFYLGAFTVPSVKLRADVATPHDWLFYVDTSASSAEGAEHRIRALENVLAGLPASDRVKLVAFDNELMPLANGSAAELARSAGSLLRTRLFLGGTDLVGVIRDIAKNVQPGRAIVVASDLVATLGETEPKALNDAMATIPRNALVHVLVLGSREDSATAKALTAGRGRVVHVPFSESLDRNATMAAEELRRPLGVSVDMADASAEWVYPTHFDDVQPGDEVIVLGKVKAGAVAAPMFVNAPRAETQSSSLSAATFAPLLEREAYRAYLEYLAQREANEPSEAVRRALATEQVRISVEQRVVIPRTTMLVLESEWDYQRFGLDRRALAAILTIDAGGIGRVDRTRLDMPVTRPVDVQPKPMPVMPPPANAAPAPMPEVSPREEGDFVSGWLSMQEVQGVAVDAVEGGVEGGVAGGVAGGVVSEAPVALSVMPPPPPRPVVPRVDAPQERRRQDGANADTSWTRRERPTKEAMAALQARLREKPQDREAYNQLGEALVLASDWSALRTLAIQWQPFDPENPQVYELLGMADEQLGNETEAARANASLIEVAPSKTELLQRAGLLLLRSHRARLAEAPLRRALELRPDRVNGYRHLALMLWLEGRHEEAARVLESATRQQFPNWYRDAQRVVREELGYVYRAWMVHEPSRRAEIEQRAREYAVDLDRRDALRVTLAWETDANDVDLHVADPAGETCYYAHTATRSGLELYEDITQGLGPEVIRTDSLKTGTYHVGVRYFAAGPMGISRGIVVILRGDDVEIEPFRLVAGGRDIRYVTAIDV
ncbi:MAG: hypothetical protein QOH21_308, partial [Acidobacteriota bacterium]|nr:hypothetical protein [Acidobacteriota bacterium]